MNPPGGPHEEGPGGVQGRKLRVGVIGLGMAGGIMVPVIAGHPQAVLAGAADPNAALRARITADHSIQADEDALQLLQRPDIDAVYIATPHQFHREHVILAAQHGKHIIVEKPMALTLEDCDAMIAAVRAAGVCMIVGHTHSFDPAVRYMREATLAGTWGRLSMIAMWNFTDFLYRPRRPEELDTSQGGGILFNQIPHQVDIARAVAHSPVRTVRAVAGMADPRRPTEGHCTALIDFESGAAASMVYSGYDHFDSDELHGWIGGTGRAKQPRHGKTRAAWQGLKGDEEAALRQSAYGYGGGFLSDRPTHQPHFGLIVGSYEQADIRVTPYGVNVYADGGKQEVALPGASDARADVLSELCDAVLRGTAPVHDGVFAKATVASCLAILESARSRREVRLD